MSDTEAGTVGSHPNVYIATTGGPCAIADLQRREGAHSSFVSTVGNFRPLHWTKDYDDFVRNALPQAMSKPGPYNLVVETSPDFGLSWELPVLIAHLLQDSPPRGQTIWATGRIDSDLRPVPADDYEIETKIEQSRELIAHLAPDLVAIMPPPMSDSERGRIEAEFASANVVCRFPADLEELCACLDLPGAHSDSVAGDGGDPRAERRRRSRRRASLRVAVLTLATGLGAAFLLTGQHENLSWLSTLGKTPGPATAQALAIHGIYTAEDVTCYDQLNTTLPEQSVPARRDAGAARYWLEHSENLCRVRFSNDSRTAMTLHLDPILISHGAPMLNPPGTMVELPANGFRTIFFGSPPAPGDLTLYLDGQTVTLTLE